MSNPNVPGGGGGPKLPWEEDSSSGQSFGATGVFGRVEVPEEPKGLPATPAPFQAPAPVPAAQAFAEPVVHKVVFGGGVDENSTELIDKIRMVSAERQAVVEKPAAAGTAGQGSSGFTELLRTLGSDASAVAPAPRAIPTPEMRAAAPVSGFTSLLQTLNAAQTPTAPMPIPAIPVRAMQPEAPPVPVESPRAAPASGGGGFTELLRATDLGGPEPVFPQAPPPASSWGAPLGGAATPAVENKPGAFTQMFGSLGSAEASPPVNSSAPTPSENKPGAFTQMFASLGSVEASPAMSGSAPRPAEGEPGSFTQLFGGVGSAEPRVPAPAPIETRDSSSSGPGSFTRMLSIEPPSTPSAATYREEPPPLPGRVDYAQTPGKPEANAAGQAGQLSGDPFAREVPESLPPMESAPATGSVGITRLLQILDEPAQAMAPMTPAPPAAPAAGPGLWTQTFEALAKPGAAAAAPPAAPSWTPPPAAPAPPPVSQFAPQAAPAAPAASGPSEFTRILDASKMREIAMRGGANAAESAAAAPRQAAPAAPGMPGFPVSAPSVQVSGPQVSGFSAQPPSFSAAPPQVSTPQLPGAYTPQMPSVPAPQPPAVKPPEPPPNKLQAYVPLLLVAIIVLLVVILVVVIFLMKH